ncbi:hypothetical protein P7K49_011917 [Saguinus oedipus]|uniref:Uncharacterized protein n=1 Tax=Saguinus oedipus TaxID=9490 RepID=A0ABQ9VSR4_SAGOE|nr:hypothetical protein P7K49_011917 [Saguinus oedipus]
MGTEQGGEGGPDPRCPATAASLGTGRGGEGGLYPRGPATAASLGTGQGEEGGSYPRGPVTVASLGTGQGGPGGPRESRQSHPFRGAGAALQEGPVLECRDAVVLEKGLPGRGQRRGTHAAAATSAKPSGYSNLAVNGAPRGMSGAHTYLGGPPRGRLGVEAGRRGADREL